MLEYAKFTKAIGGANREPKASRTDVTAQTIAQIEVRLSEIQDSIGLGPQFAWTGQKNTA
jgi:hypothetical protein